MRTDSRRGRPALNVLFAVLALVLSILPPALPAAAQEAGESPVALAPLEQAGCTFTLGFKALRDQIPQVVGTCLENERFNQANGNTEQRTSGGLLVWRKADNWTAFTNGATTWLAGPCGLQTRPNAGPYYAWEGRIGATCF